jgi:hypothetical protein
MRVRRGARFLTGDRLGTVNTFNHSHLEVGWARQERNPLHFRLTQLDDHTPPVIRRSGVRLFAADGQPITRAERGRLLVESQVEVVVDAWDQVDGNAARRRLGLYSIGYQVLHPDESPAPGFAAPRQTIGFDRLPGEAAASLLFAAEQRYSGIRQPRLALSLPGDEHVSQRRRRTRPLGHAHAAPGGLHPADVGGRRRRQRRAAKSRCSGHHPRHASARR